MLPMGYSNLYEIIQTPDHVALFAEVIHDARIIPLDGRAHVDPKVRQYWGDSRGRWEGDTLVVEVTNFSDKTFGTQQPAGNYRGGGKDMKIVERFRRVDDRVLEYSARIEDSRAFTRPWTLTVPLVKDDSQMYEYACHEGNYGTREYSQRRVEGATEEHEMKHRVLAVTSALIGGCALIGSLSVQTNAQGANAARSSSSTAEYGSEDTVGSSGSAGCVDHR